MFWREYFFIRTPDAKHLNRGVFKVDCFSSWSTIWAGRSRLVTNTLKRYCSSIPSQSKSFSTDLGRFYRFFPQQSYAFVERNRMNVVEIPFFTVHHETIGEEAAVSPDEPHLLIRQNRKCLIKKRSVVAQICCIARTQPGVHYHSHLGCKGDKGWWEGCPGLGGLYSLLFFPYLVTTRSMVMLAGSSYSKNHHCREGNRWTYGRICTLTHKLSMISIGSYPRLDPGSGRSSVFIYALIVVW